ncbi:MAG: DUF3422 family protein, partial [Gammaproteobacteria bacterium]|nr:DUF3422 family protein [Gammaproteobacteria bacterium]
MNRDITPAQSLAEANNLLKKTLVGLPEHEQRFKLHNELHTGAVDSLDAPTQMSHLALLCGSDQVENERRLIAQLCEHYGVTPPTQHSNHFNAMLGVCRVNWERHTEYSTYTFSYSAPFETPFAEPAINYIPKEWLATLPGEIIAATHIA